MLHNLLLVYPFNRKYGRTVVFKDGLSLKIKKIHIHLYFIATQYLWCYALVKDIDNLTQSYILIIIYWNRQK